MMDLNAYVTLLELGVTILLTLKRLEGEYLGYL